MDFNKFGSKAGIESLTVQVVQEDAPYVSTTSNPGNIRVNADAAEILGVDYGAVNTTSKEQPGERMEFGTRLWGADATEKSKLCYLLPAGTKQGSKLASPSKQNGGVLQCSSANAWNKLDGSEDMLKWYTIDAAHTAIAFADDNSVLTLEAAIEGGLVDAKKWTSVGAEYGLGIAGEEVLVYHKMTFVKETAKRVVTGGGRKKPATTTVEKPFANVNADAADISDDEFDL